MKFYLFHLVVTVLVAFKIAAQPCTNAGQAPSTAIPVCGTSIFTQSAAPQCGSFNIPVTCANAGPEYMDRNPYWYKFTCYSAGTLGFVITPGDLGEDYDWQLFDITDHTPDEIFHNHALTVSYNWSGETGITGASSAGTSTMVCGGLKQPLFATMPAIQQGHDYLLMISHYENSGNGYTLEFKGGTAVLFDPVLPALSTAAVSCDATVLTVKLNKKLMCNSLAMNGTDFSLSTPAATIVSATGYGCHELELDSVSLLLSGPLPTGHYTVTCITGDDGNTLLDNCGLAIATGDNIGFSVPPLQYANMDSVQHAACAPQVLNLILSNAVNCSSIAMDGSDFIIHGPEAVTTSSAHTGCMNGLTRTIALTLSKPMVNAGAFSVILQQGADGNTMINECGLQTPAGTSVPFVTSDTVSAAFSYRISGSCTEDTVNYLYFPSKPVVKWQWLFDNAANSASQNPVKIYNLPGAHTTRLMATNGTCSDTSSISFTLNNKLNAGFTVNDRYCPENPVVFQNNSTGNVKQWSWTFGNGATSDLQTPPPQHYPANGQETDYRVTLKVADAAGCIDSSSTMIKILSSCRIAVPSAFSPNHDGLNDYLFPINAFNTAQFNFRVYSRWGQLIFFTTDPQKKWDGTVKGFPQPAGIYIWTLQFLDPVTGNKTAMKGTTMLIR